MKTPRFTLSVFTFVLAMTIASPAVGNAADIVASLRARTAPEQSPQGFPIREGVTHLEQATDLDDADYSSTWPGLANYLKQLQQGERGAAKSTIQGLNTQGRADEGALNLLAQIERQDGNLDAALKLIENAIKLAPRQHLHYFQKALICFQLREKSQDAMTRWDWHTRTMAAYERALELEPKGVYYRYYVAYSYLQTPAYVGGDKQKALKLAQDGIDMGLDAFYVIRADVHRSLDQPNEAFADYDRSIKLRVFKTNSFLGAIQAALGRKDLTRARSYCDYLARCLPADPRSDEANGDYYAASGDMEKAVQSYRSALKRNPNLKAVTEKLNRLAK